jgi:hypothetical protein
MELYRYIKAFGFVLSDESSSNFIGASYEFMLIIPKNTKALSFFRDKIN